MYTNGAIDCGTGGLTDLDGQREQVRLGRVATTLDEGGWASAHHVAGWRFAVPRPWIDGEMLIGEITDEIDRLDDQPTDRCLLAVEQYLADMTEDNRLAMPATGAAPCRAPARVHSATWTTRTVRCVS